VPDGLVSAFFAIAIKHDAAGTTFFVPNKQVAGFPLPIFRASRRRLHTPTPSKKGRPIITATMGCEITVGPPI